MIPSFQRSHSALVALLVCALVACDGAPATDTTDGAPDLVLLYLIDTLRADHLGAYGYDRDSSPQLDAFAADAVLFERAHAQAPWTKASVASLLTGLLPAYTDATEKHQRLPARLDTLAEVFSRAGFRTAGFVANPWVTSTFGFEQGFDTFHDVTREDSVLMSNAEDMNRALLPYFEKLSRDRPHFVYVHARDPHDPYSPPAPYDSMFGADYKGSLDPEQFDWRLDVDAADLEHLVALYDGEIRYLDHHFGELLAALKHQGLYDNALIIVTSDHGEEFLDHGRWKHGRDLYQTLIHVPLIVRFPAGAHGGTRVQDDVALLDVFPTLIESAGLKAPPALQGTSLLPLIAGKQASRPIVAHESRHGRELVSVIEDRHKLIREISPKPSIQLFNLASDPGELHDVASAEPARVDALARIARQQIAAAQEGLSVRFFGDGRPHHVEGRVSTTGRIVELAGYQLRDGDTLATNNDGRDIAFEFSLARNQSFSLRDDSHVYDNEFVDERGFRFRVEPSDATLEWTLQLDGNAFPREQTLLGPGETQPAALPFALAGDDARLLRDDAILPLNNAYLRASPVHARIWRIESANVEKARISPEIEQRLEALGYVE